MISLFLGVLSSATLSAAHADMDCRVYSAPMPPKQISCDYEFNQWLKQNRASCDPSYYCKDGYDAVIKLVGKFQTSGTGRVSFQFEDYRGHEKDFSQGIPERVGKPQCNSVFRLGDAAGGDKNTSFTCYDAGKWSSQRYLFPKGCAFNSITSGSVSGAIPRKGSEPIFGVGENTQVYVMGPNPNSPFPGASSDLLFVGADCAKMITTSQWAAGALCHALPNSDGCVENEYAQFFREQMTNFKQNASVIDHATGAFPGFSSRPAEGTDGGPLSTGSEAGSGA